MLDLEIISIDEINESKIREKICVKFEEEDNLLLQEVNIFKSTFLNMGLKKASFDGGNISNSRFEDCYLRYATFNNINLTGSVFINCDLSNAKFRSCNIRYVKFVNCQINIKEVLGSLPTETNLKIQLLKELRINQISIGNNKNADELLIKILDAEKKLCLERVKCETSYHQEREDIGSRIKAFYSYIVLSLNDLIWGYGLKLSRLFFSALTIIFVFAVLIYLFTNEEYISTTVFGSTLIELSFWDSVYVSYTNFISLGYGNYIPNTTITRIIFIIENTLGYIFLGFLVSGVYRRISK